MSRRSIILIVGIFILCFFQLSAFAAGKHALLISIGDYGNLHALAGPKNDVRIVEGMLRDVFEFQDEVFIILRDSAATHSGIERAFAELTEQVQTDDFVYIHYSGHGSQTKDLNGDEPDGLDQTWVSYGARTNNTKHKDNYDVLDDEIYAWLTALYDKTHDVVFVSDSCHSGTVSRGDAVNRMIEEDEREHPLGRQEYPRLEKYYGIHIGAARNFESALERKRHDGKTYGVFTYYWVQALFQSRAGESWNDVFKRTYAQVTGERGNGQRPQLEGERSRQLIGGGFRPLQSTIPVIDVDGDQVTIGAGFLAGVTRESVYRLSDLEEETPELLPTLTITKVEDFSSTGIAQGWFQGGDLVVEESHAYHFDPVKVYIDVGENERSNKTLVEAIQAAFLPGEEGLSLMPGYTLTDAPGQADVRLHLLRPAKKHGKYVYDSPDDLHPRSFPEQAAEVWVESPEQRLLYDSLRIKFGDIEQGIEKLSSNLNKVARIRELKALTSQYSASSPVEALTFILRPVDSCPKDAECLMLPQGLGYRQKNGPYTVEEMREQAIKQYDILTFTLKNTSQHDYFCYVINISPDGAIASIFPDPEERDEYARFNAGQTRDLSDITGLYTEFVGEETVKLIITRYPIDIALLQQERFRRDVVRNPMEHLLSNAVHGFRGPVSLRNDEWATEQFEFEVK